VRARQLALDGKLQAGRYVLRRNMTVDEALQALQHPQAEDVRVTIPEGLRLEQTADLLRQSGLLDASEFLRLAQNPPLDRDFLQSRPAGASLEGYLFPDTYSVGEKTVAQDFVAGMLDRFAVKVTTDLRAGFAARGLSLHQAVTLASIVEREAQVASERPPCT